MVVHNYYPLGEIRVEREAKALIDGGFEVDVICLRLPGEPPRASEYDVQIYRLPVQRHYQRAVSVQLLEYLAFFLLATWQLLKLHLRRRYATIQVHNLMVYSVPAGNVSALAEAAVEVLSNKEQLRRLAENIKRFNGTHNWRNEAKAYVHLVEGLAREG